MSTKPAMAMTRVFDAPRELVFRTWTDPVHLARWWGPKGFSNPVCRFEARQGGSIRIDMQAPDGLILPNRGVVREYVPPERLVFTLTFIEEDGSTRFENLNTVTFTEEGARTRLSLTVDILFAKPGTEFQLSGMDEGWRQSLERLDDTLYDLEHTERRP